MNKLLMMLLSAVVVTAGVNTYSFTDIDGNEMNMSAFEGKKVLIVNTASGSERVSQYAGLDSLYQMYHDSLVIIAFPSNSFGNEPLDNAGIKSFISNNYSRHYILASKVNITGEDQHPLFQWLTKDSLNNAVSTSIQNDFYKFLLDENGELMGVYAGEVEPMDSIIIKAIGLPSVEEEQ
jgi:glutathione peroxidase